jgi:transposase
MRQVREILRLKLSDREIGRSLSIARSTVALNLEARCSGRSALALPVTLTDRVPEAMLYAGHGSQQGARRKAERAYVHHALRRLGVTLMLLWEEYRQQEPGGYRDSRWCELYRAWEGRPHRQSIGDPFPGAKLLMA